MVVVGHPSLVLQLNEMKFLESLNLNFLGLEWILSSTQF